MATAMTGTMRQDRHLPVARPQPVSRMPIQHGPGNNVVRAGANETMTEPTQICSGLTAHQSRFGHGVACYRNEARFRQKAGLKQVSKIGDIFSMDVPDPAFDTGRTEVMNPEAGHPLRVERATAGSLDTVGQGKPHRRIPAFAKENGPFTQKRKRR